VRQPLRWLRQGRRLDEGPDARQMQPFLAKGRARLTTPDVP